MEHELEILKICHLSETELKKRAMNALWGRGDCCQCGCQYSGNTGSTTKDNGHANFKDDDITQTGTKPGGTVSCWIPEGAGPGCKLS